MIVVNIIFNKSFCFEKDLQMVLDNNSVERGSTFLSDFRKIS